MGNKTNTENWSARERLMHVERLAYWRGWVRRADLCEKFGISTPQASVDISEYLRRNPRALRYDLSRKRYEAMPAMRRAFGKGTLEEATLLFAAMEPGSLVDRVARIDLPYRHVPPDVLRAIVRAVLATNMVEIYYYSVNSGTEGWRWIVPQAFAHDGYRWHVRAWCQEDTSFKDFVLGRISKVRSPHTHEGPLPKDRDWTTWVTVRFRAHPQLSSIQRAAIERDFAIEDGVASFRVRTAMLLYTLVHLGLEPSKNQPVRRLELVEIADNRTAKSSINHLARAP